MMRQKNLMLQLLLLASDKNVLLGLFMLHQETVREMYQTREESGQAMEQPQDETRERTFEHDSQVNKYLQTT